MRLKKIGEWLNASPEDQDKQNADLLQTLSKLTGKQLDANALQMLQNLLQAVESKNVRRDGSIAHRNGENLFRS